MKFNDEHVTLYRDKKGPYDGYYHRGCVYDSIGKHKTVSYAFDYMGQHYGVIRPKLYIKTVLVSLVLLAAVAFGAYKVITYDSSESVLVVYMPHAPTVVNGDILSLEIINLMDKPAYISVGDNTYEISAGDTITSVPFFSYVQTITITYEDRSVVKEIIYD